MEWGAMMEKLRNIHEDVGGINLRLDKQNGRIGKLEKWQWKVAGGVGALAILVPLALKAMGII
jgi:hypothetical protein